MPDKQQPMTIKAITYTVFINPILPFILITSKDFKGRR